MFSTIKPKQDYILGVLLLIFLVLNALAPKTWPLLWLGSIIGTLPTMINALRSLRKLKISIDTFNTFAIIIALVLKQLNSAAFIALMLTFARILDAHTTARASKALEELLKLKPEWAQKETDNEVEQIPTDQVQIGDILVVKEGSSVPVDGIIIFGKGFLNESPVTGESAPIEKMIGDKVLSSTINEIGVFKMRATHVGKDSTVERMATLVKEASAHKSHSEHLADKFAGIFLPLVLLIGFLTYLFTHSLLKTAAIFLVACADDMAVAIPLAITASLGQAARRGVIIKGGQWLDVLGKIKTLILDKTGTLTYGSFAISAVALEPQVDENKFWRIVAIAEKFSEHPFGRAMFREAFKRLNHTDIPDPENFNVIRGSGIVATIEGSAVAIGNEKILSEPQAKNVVIPEIIMKKFNAAEGTASFVIQDGKLLGMITVADTPRMEAANSIRKLESIGVKNIHMLTGDKQNIAKRVANQLGIKNYQGSMLPEEKMRTLEKLTADGVVAMIGDGVNDAAALARADIGIAMGSSGTAVAVEAADVVILNDNLDRVPEMILLGRKTSSVIYYDMGIWLISNAVGFVLVLTNVFGPALAAFYNFATDFLPLINSARLFKKEHQVSMGVTRHDFVKSKK